ncbi:MAG: GNAT family N-acetyltransferase [Acidimicrobiales bacterium]
MKTAGDETVDSACDLCGPEIELTRGGRLRLRHTQRDDVPGLRALYGQLTLRDLRRRFFTAGSPSDHFLEYWVGLEDQGGCGLVAEVIEDGQNDIVGEAGYAKLADHGSDGELGITVAPKSRGWLGAWLLDRLLAHAHQRGIENLQAVVLVDNRTMMGLAAKRGYAVLGHLDWGTVRITMATEGSVPSWPGGHEKPRVLIETNHSRWLGEEALTDAGFDIALCGEWCRSGRACPVFDGDACPLLAGADAVVIDLPDAERIQDLLNREEMIHPGIRYVSGLDEDGVRHRLSPETVLEQLRDLLAEQADDD